MRPILVFVPAKPAFVILALAGAVLTALGLVPRFRKSQAFSYGWFLLLAALVVGRVGTGEWAFWSGWGRPWDPVPIYSYGVMLGLSLIIGWYLAIRLATAEGLPRDKIASLYMWTAVMAVVASRLLYVFTNWGDFEGNLVDIVKVNKGGLVAYGGFLGGFLASLVYCLRNQIPILKWADNAVPSISLGLALTRIGCFLYGCDFGARSSLPWAVRFPGPSRFAKFGSPAFELHVRNYDLPQTATASFPVHPTQLYESLLGLCLLFACLLVRKYRKTDGFVFLTFIWGYGVPRFLLEFIRDDEQRGKIGRWSTSQIIAFVTSLLGIALFFYLRDRARRGTEAADAVVPAAPKKRKQRS
ncbi:MAG TPA: prolipoprotein diacylglyceryl transferase [Polyangia bacterium]|nr:prolipoprotein diacylglyceryl transferase [Polyangia bacterium]